MGEKMRHNTNHKEVRGQECQTCKEEEAYDKTKKFEKRILGKK
jgi:hypothetical protein